MTTLARSGKKATEPLRPEPAAIIDVITETPDIKTFRVVFDDPEVMEIFSFLPGQIGQLSVLGAGESTFAISSAPSRRDCFEFSVMKAGVVTSALHELTAGDRIAVRAPMGCAFPTDEWKGRNIVLVGGGIGMAPLRSLLLHLLDHRGDYGDITLVYGARTPGAATPGTGLTGKHALTSASLPPSTPPAPAGMAASDWSLQFSRKKRHHRITPSP